MLQARAYIDREAKALAACDGYESWDAAGLTDAMRQRYRDEARDTYGLERSE